MRLLKFLTIFILAAVLFTSCAPKEDEEVEIEFWHAMQGPLLVTLEKLVKNFETENPNITVHLKYQGRYSQLLKRLESEIATGTPPDISQAFGAWTDKFIADNLLVSLNNKLEGAEKDFYEVFYRNNLFNGELYSIPFNKSMPILYYNKDLFSKAGLDPEKPPATWDEFKTYSITLKKELNKDNPEETIYPFSFAPSIWFITTMYLQNQGVIYEKETKAIIPNKEIMVDAIDFFLQLHKDKLMELTKDRSYQDRFIQGKSAMILASCVSRTFMKDDIKFNYGLTPFPQGKVKASILSGTNLIVFKSKNKSKTKAAVKLINFLLKPENVATWVMETNYLPCRKSALTVPFFAKHLKKEPGLIELYKEIDYLQQEPKEKKWVNGRKILRSKLEKIFFLNIPTNEALDEFYKEIK